MGTLDSKHENKLVRHAMGLLAHRDILAGSLLEQTLLNGLAVNGWIAEGPLYVAFMPKNIFSGRTVTTLANAYDDWIELMKHKHSLWSFIPKDKNENVMLCTHAAYTEASKEKRAAGRFVPSKLTRRR